MIVYLTGTDIGSYMYCQASFYLSRVMGYKPKVSRDLFSGYQKHSELFDEAEKVKPPFTFEEGLPQAFSGRIEPFSMREVSIKSDKHRFVGRIDEVYVKKNLVRIIDDKKADKAYPSSKMQVYAYALAFQDMYGPYPIEVAIRNSNTSKEVWSDKFNSAKKRDVINLLSEMWDVVNGKKKPTPTDNARKCERCGLNYICEFYKARISPRPSV